MPCANISLISGIQFGRHKIACAIQELHPEDVAGRIQCPWLHYISYHYAEQVPQGLLHDFSPILGYRCGSCDLGQPRPPSGVVA